MEQTVKFVLDESRLPDAWYNLAADLPSPPPPPLHPGTRQPVGPDDLAPLFPMAADPAGGLDRAADRDPRARSRRLPAVAPDAAASARAGSRRRCETPAKIYYKYEGVSPGGSHKPNTAVAQAFYNKQEGVRRLTTETGAGQWGSALAFAGALFGLEVEVFMVQGQLRPEAVSTRAHGDVRRALRRRARRTRPRAGARSSPSTRTRTGSLGIAISRGGRGRRAARRHEVLARLGAEPRADAPDGDRAGGASSSSRWRATTPTSHRLHRRRHQLRGHRLPVHRRGSSAAARTCASIAVEPAACPSLTRGTYAYDFGDTGQLTPLVKMHTLGSTFVPPGFHAGGLRYHGMAPMVSHLKRARPDRGARLSRRRRCSRPASSSRAPRASCPRPRRTTP